MNLSMYLAEYEEHELVEENAIMISIGRQFRSFNLIKYNSMRTIFDKHIHSLNDQISKNSILSLRVKECEKRG
jgi:hypothetical protein